MSSSPTITLFSEQRDQTRGPVALAASALIHTGVIALVGFGVLYAPRVEVHTDRHYVVRNLDLRSPEEAMERAARGIAYPGHPRATRQSSAAGTASRPRALRETVPAQPGPQTIIQPDLAASLAMKEQIPIPQVLIWTPRKTVVKNIVAPLPTPPTASEAKPSPAAPNQEVTVSDVEIASSLSPLVKLQIMPSTTSPVVVHGPDRVQSPPSTVSQTSQQPTPAAVLSLSDLRMQGAATLPPVNESASTAAPGTMSPAAASDGTATGDAAATGASGNSGSGTGPGSSAGAATPAGRQGQPDGASTGAAQGANSGTGQNQNTTAEVTLPKTGTYSSVVVGDSLQDQYPELSGVWNGRMAYTVYLHVGLARSWILQYSLPANARIAVTGGADRLEAPWPYSIVRPNLATGAIEADALMVHGFVDTAGHFEGLAVVFPAAFPQAQFVLDSLARWQFRPATENGQIARVEVLLIIPEELD